MISEGKTRPVCDATSFQYEYDTCSHFYCSIEALLRAHEQEQISKAIKLGADDRSKLLAVVRWRLVNPHVNITSDFNDASIEEFLGVEHLYNN
jgi:tRNA threonylcarbamoyladenosine modification (KEOPS) complex Cgi121 subunit